VAKVDGHLPFIFVGTKECIENAMVLVEYNIIFLRDVEQLQQQKQRLEDELRAAEKHHSSRSVPPASLSVDR